MSSRPPQIQLKQMNSEGLISHPASSTAWISKGLGFGELVLASVNIFGGFLVTARMLAMYKKKEKSS